jgi:hypothetical protein
MAAGKQDILIEQGATFRWVITLYNPLLDLGGDPVSPPQADENNPVDLTGYTARMQVREKVDSPDPMLSISDATGEITGLDNTGLIEIEVADEVTSTISKSGVYDLEIESAGGIVTRLFQGKARLSKEVTR